MSNPCSTNRSTRPTALLCMISNCRARSSMVICLDSGMARTTSMAWQCCPVRPAFSAAMQETCLRAFTSLQSFRGDCALGTWLASIAINLALDARRKRGRAVQLDDTQDLGIEPTLEHWVAFHAPSADSPDAQAEGGLMRALLHRAINGLPVIYRSVFILRAVEEMSVDETASYLQVSDAVAKTRYLRARSMLREA